jgi:hypothetical protein
MSIIEGLARPNATISSERMYHVIETYPAFYVSRFRVYLSLVTMQQEESTSLAQKGR